VIDERCPWVVRQAGVITRRQALMSGMTPGQVRARVRSGRWRSLGPGVLVTFTGPLPPEAELWAALLRAGAGAVAGPRTTLWLLGLRDEPPSWDVLIPAHRRVREDHSAAAGVRRRKDLDLDRHPTATIPQLRVEAAVIEACAVAPRPEQVIDLVLAAVQRRLTTAGRLDGYLRARTRHRWRGLLIDLLAQTQDGVRSPLERRWVLDVERPHGLPSGRLNHREDTAEGVRYRDVEYAWGVICELDGREAHPDEARFRDRHRDNRVAVSGRITLRYGWREVVGEPCAVALEVAQVLRRRGWSGEVRPCGSACPARYS